MAKMLLVVNGADYSMEAVRKAVWLAQKDGAQVEVLYINPTCVQLYPNVPGLCFWMPEFEYKIRARQLRERVLNEDITPILEEAQLDTKLLITDKDQDTEIKRLSEINSYDKIFITGHSKYCTPESYSWLSLWRKPQDIPTGTVCLI
ncbi:MAG: universal stress protein [Desulfotomaculaceae bacterium]